MAVATFYVLLQPEFSDKKNTQLKRVKAADMRQTPPMPGGVGMWMEINIEVPDAVFKHLIPTLNAKINDAALEAMLAQSSELHARIIGVDDDT